jgi:non-ribosomal peptide synthetase component F
MFNTGDIVCWRDDGSLEIFGRKDDQVKIKVDVVISYASISKSDRDFVSSSMGLRE